MNAAIRIFGFALTATALAAQPQIAFDYGNPLWGGRITIGGHAAFSNASVGALPDLRADLGATFEQRVRINGRELQAFYAQGDLDARLQTTLTAVNGQLRSIVNESMALAGLVRVGGRTVQRSSALEAQLDVLIPAQSFTTSGNIPVVVPLSGPFAATIGVSGVADVSASFRPIVTQVPRNATLSVTFAGNAEGRLSVAAGAPTLGEVSVAGILDYADPTAFGSSGTNFQTVTRVFCWTLGTFSLRFDVVARQLFGIEIRRNVVNLGGTLSSICTQLF